MSDPKNILVDRICVVTGANSGIGKATARGLAQQGATVVLVCRNRERGEMARAEIAPFNLQGGTELFVADLSVQAEVRRLSNELCERHPCIHVLVHNAGLQLPQRTLSADGIEMTLAVNHLAPFLLTRLLLENLKAGSLARIIVVSSLVHKWGRLNLGDLQLAHGYTMERAYYQSKLCNVLFARKLAKALVGTSVTVNSLEPGLVDTAFGRVYTGAQGWFVRNIWMPLFAQTPERGARTSIYLTSSSKVAGVSGQHFANCRIKTPSPMARDDVLADRLWQASDVLVGLT